MFDLQSAYCINHLAETALLKVLADILWVADSGDLAVLALLDFSAAFDTVNVDHETLRHRRSKSYGLGRTGSSLTSVVHFSPFAVENLHRP